VVGEATGKRGLSGTGISGADTIRPDPGWRGETVIGRGCIAGAGGRGDGAGGGFTGAGETYERVDGERFSQF